ncbi:hypothetical protein [Demequina litorisediminis]|uniref:hypothetical protein n=1 Tax=Demequina litorisediminis TaxID=1849022 RepID=UPI0024E0B29F|nr:hypothetical protein [Demequina litorisediminis]
MGNDVYLELLTDPYTRTISARYSIADGPTNLLMSTIVPGAWFSLRRGRTRPRDRHPVVGRHHGHPPQRGGAADV